MKNKIDLSSLAAGLNSRAPYQSFGRVVRVIGQIIESEGPNARLGEICHVVNTRGEKPLMTEVVGFKENRLLLMPLGELIGLAPGAEVISSGKRLAVAIGDNLLGRILDGLGNPIDGKGSLESKDYYNANNTPPPPLSRQRITESLSLGIKSIDSLITCGRGQRIGIFAGSGVGKSSLLAMCARYTAADVIVIGLIGERGREVKEFIENNLGSAGLKRSVVIASTSDKPALIRVKGALVTTAIAEYFRDQGKDVLMIMDSVTRVATALREVGLAVGEPPATRGYTPSVFAFLPLLLERSGSNELGTITALYSVLVEGDDLQEPVTDTVRGILDGHIVLSRDLASEGHFPAIDPLNSISRLMPQIVTSQHMQAANKLRRVLAAFYRNRDLVSIGAYEKGNDPDVDFYLTKREQINSFLQQNMEQQATLKNTIQELEQLMRGVA